MATSQVEVERVAATADEPAAPRSSPSRSGLTAQGFAEITPVGGTLEEGDRVLVGISTESGEATDEETDTGGDGG